MFDISSLSANQGKTRAAAWSIIALQFVLFAFLTIRTPYTYETTYTSDTMFMLNVAWAIRQGFEPVTDFHHLYGGLLSRMIAGMFSATGVSVKAFDYVHLLVYFLAAALTLVAGWRRLNPISLLAALTIVAALAFTRNPLEDGAPSISVASHAMFYNRMGWLFLFAALLPAVLPVHRGSELPGCAASAFAAFLMIASKPTFIIAVAAFAVGFLLSGRYRLLIPWAVAFVLAGSIYWAATGHGPQEWLALFRYIHELGGRVASKPSEPMLKLLLITGSNFFDLAIVLFICGLLLARDYLHFRQIALAAMVVLAVGLAITVTTGAFKLHFAQTPIPAMLAVILFEAAVRRDRADLTIVLGSSLVVLTFALPHLLNAVSTGLKENRYPALRIETEGAFATYAVEPDTERRLPLERGLDDVERLTASRLEGVRDLHFINEQQFFLVVANGLRALRAIDGYQGLGVVSPYRRMFTLGLEAKPVLSYPFDPRIESPEFDGLASLQTDVDVVMILRADDSVAELRDLLLKAAGDDFELRNQTLFWDIYRRRAR